jgi:tetratricopeptide (TPR) repeat protein
MERETNIQLANKLANKDPEKCIKVLKNLWERVKTKRSEIHRLLKGLNPEATKLLPNIKDCAITVLNYPENENLNQEENLVMGRTIYTWAQKLPIHKMEEYPQIFIQLMQKILKKTPIYLQRAMEQGSTTAGQYLATWYMEWNRYKEAEEIFDILENMGLDTGGMWNQRGNNSIKLGKYKRAKKEYLKAVERSETKENTAMAYTNLAISLLYQKNITEAHPALLQAHEHGSKTATAILATIAIRTGKDKKTREKGKKMKRELFKTISDAQQKTILTIINDVLPRKRINPNLN